jgi:hypothetical protein
MTSTLVAVHGRRLTGTSTSCVSAAVSPIRSRSAAPSTSGTCGGAAFARAPPARIARVSVTLAYTMPFDARCAADVIKVPVLIVHSEDALTPDLAHAVYAAPESPRQDLWLQSRGQIDFYDDAKLITPRSQCG